jgi:hypothetical protein
MLEFYSQLIESQPTAKNKEEILLQGTFMCDITSQILADLDDYHDSVREEAQLLLLCMTERFLPPQIALNDD